jgi:5-(carboxyamino)imidazole ribonucleotide mutase
MSVPSPTASPVVGIIMGSSSDWPTLRAAAEARGLRCLIAGAGGAAHLPGMAAALTPLPVLGVPVRSRALEGLDSLLSIVQMPAGIPVAAFAIGPAGAAEAAWFAAAILRSAAPPA